MTLVVGMSGAVRTARLAIGVWWVLAAAGCDRSTDEPDPKAEPKVAVSQAPEAVPAKAESAPPPKAAPPVPAAPPASPAALLATFEGSPAELVVRALDGKTSPEVLRKPLGGRAVARLWSDSHGLVVVLDEPPAVVTVNQGSVTRHAGIEWGLDSSIAELADGRVVHRECDFSSECEEARDTTLLPAPEGHRAVAPPSPYADRAPEGFGLEITEVSETRLDLACRSPKKTVTIPSEGREGAVLTATAQWLTRAPGLFLLDRELDWTEAQEVESVLMQACDAEPLSTDPALVWGPDHWWAFGDGKQWSVRDESTERLRLPQGSSRLAKPAFVGQAILES